jgi:tRNA threonylcarbamoyladenosine biosynthesis protein TsaB
VKLLAMDTSTRLGSVALSDASGRVTECAIGTSVRHAESLLPAISALLAEAGLSPSDLAGVVVGEGPGSFTGVRVAAATSLGLSGSLGIPLFAFGSLLAEAAAVGVRGRPVCALFDARRAEVYAACHRFDDHGWRDILEPGAYPVADVLERLAPLAPLWTGEAVFHIAAALPDAEVPAPVETRAAALLRLARSDPAAGRVDRSAWEPAYLRP